MASNSKWKMVAFNVFGGLSIFFILVAIRSPLLINSVQNLGSDEAFQAVQILNLVDGNELYFYFDGERYAGVFYGLAAVPFFWIFGTSALAYKLPGVLFYTLYILSSYWIAKKIKPTAALVVIFLLIFSSPAVLSISTSNWPHNLICLLGNLIFLTFFRLMEPGSFRQSDVFLLGFLIGFAIYSYTFSILYISSIVVLFVLSSKYWRNVRDDISVRKIMNWAIGKKDQKQRLKEVLDALICIFALVTGFSYIFGGFGVDISGHSIFQSNELGKPVYQLLILILLRVCLFRKDIKDRLSSIKYYILSTNPLIKISTALGFLGFVVGISPRLASIITGETSRGGQGFDVDLIPTRLLTHFWQLITHQFPQIIGVRVPLVQLIDYEITPFSLFYSLFAIIMLFLIIKSTIFFLSPIWQDVKGIALLKILPFSPSQIFVIFPVLVCVANVIIQHGPVTRYLLPLYGIIAIWVSLYLDNVRKTSKGVFAFSLIAWCIFSTIGIYKYYVTNNLIHNYSIVESSNPFSKAIKFLEVRKISHAYSDYGTASLITFLSGRNVKVAEYTKDVYGKRIKKQLAREGEFAIIVSHNNRNALAVYRKYMDEKLLSYSQDIVSSDDNTINSYHVFWNFEGKPEAIEALRSLVS